MHCIDVEVLDRFTTCLPKAPFSPDCMLRLINPSFHQYLFYSLCYLLVAACLPVPNGLMLSQTRLWTEHTQVYLKEKKKKKKGRQYLKDLFSPQAHKFVLQHRNSSRMTYLRMWKSLAFSSKWRCFQASDI